MKQWFKRLWCALWTHVPDGSRVRMHPLRWGRATAPCLRCGENVGLRRVSDGLWEIRR